MIQPAFTPFAIKNGTLFDYIQNQHPTILHAWDGQGMTFLNEYSTYFGYVYEGSAVLYCHAGTFRLSAGMYFAVPIYKGFQGQPTFNRHPVVVEGGKGIIIERVGYLGQFQVGGPIEPIGRLKYIDGCTDSLLIPPVMKGDPCFNALYFLPGTNQTQHTHPSMRVGMVVSGHGECITPEETIPLYPGQVFIIHEEGRHAFRTTGDSPMVVVAYHPDSDFGPEDEDHPMINRTIVEGISAAYIEEIRTK
jgi:mannose-6-phosphate isomerase-like protein (cupin superfamily)